MTKRFTIALVALALFVLIAVMPTSAYYYAVANNVSQGATVFIGEQGLNLVPAVSQAQSTAGISAAANLSTVIGWWASAAAVTTTAPTKSIDVAARATAFSQSRDGANRLADPAAIRYRQVPTEEKRWRPGGEINSGDGPGG